MRWQVIARPPIGVPRACTRSSLFYVVVSYFTSFLFPTLWFPISRFPIPYVVVSYFGFLFLSFLLPTSWFPISRFPIVRAVVSYFSVSYSLRRGFLFLGFLFCTDTSTQYQVLVVPVLVPRYAVVVLLYVQ